jgi:hypothetical protein
MQVGEIRGAKAVSLSVQPDAAAELSLRLLGAEDNDLPAGNLVPTPVGSAAGHSFCERKR